MDISALVLGFLEYCGIYRAKRRSGGGTRGGHTPPGRARRPWRALVGCPLLRTPPGATRAHIFPFGPEKIIVKFRAIWTPFDIDFLRCKKTWKKQELALGTMSIG